MPSLLNSLYAGRGGGQMEGIYYTLVANTSVPSATWTNLPIDPLSLAEEDREKWLSPDGKLKAHRSGFYCVSHHATQLSSAVSSAHMCITGYQADGITLFLYHNNLYYASSVTSLPSTNVTRWLNEGQLMCPTAYIASKRTIEYGVGSFVFLGDDSWKY